MTGAAEEPEACAVCYDRPRNAAAAPCATPRCAGGSSVCRECGARLEACVFCRRPLGARRRRPPDPLAAGMLPAYVFFLLLSRVRLEPTGVLQLD